MNPPTGFHAPISAVRMAVDAYGAKEWREGEGLKEVAYRTEKISCGVSEFAFIQARRMRVKVFGDPNATVEATVDERLHTTTQRPEQPRYGQGGDYDRKLGVRELGLPPGWPPRPRYPTGRS